MFLFIWRAYFYILGEASLFMSYKYILPPCDMLFLLMTLVNFPLKILIFKRASVTVCIFFFFPLTVQRCYPYFQRVAHLRVQDACRMNNESLA